MVSSSVVRLAGFGWQAEVLPAYGMNLIRLARSGSELLRTPEGETQLRREPQAYGMPLLLPPNRTAGGAFTFQGTTYHLPINEPVYGNHIHGSLARMPFRVTEQTATSVTGFYENRGECYPFPFAITVTHCLTETGTQHLFTLCNTGPKTMPLAFGLHIAFRAKPFCGAHRAAVGGGRAVHPHRQAAAADQRRNSLPGWQRCLQRKIDPWVLYRSRAHRPDRWPLHERGGALQSVGAVEWRRHAGFYLHRAHERCGERPELRCGAGTAAAGGSKDLHRPAVPLAAVTAQKKN